MRDDVLVAGGRDENVGLVSRRLRADDLGALHRSLQGADRVDLGDDHARALAGSDCGAALADVAVAADDATLPPIITSVAREMPSIEAVAAAVEVVELRLGDGVVDVDRRERQLAGSIIW